MRFLSPAKCFSLLLVSSLLVPGFVAAQDNEEPASVPNNTVRVVSGTNQGTQAPTYARRDAASSPANEVAEGRFVDFQPYQVFVASENAYAHCGPSTDYYRTDPLRFGQTLEVYTETADGWLGIRPPDESFCWLPAETVQLDPTGEIGTVVEDRTVSWIGTQLGRARQYRWQVQLAKGEPVTVIGRSEREGPDGPQLWYRIVPPSGEYRWVHRDTVVESTESLVEIAQRSRNAVAQGQRPTYVGEESISSGVQKTTTVPVESLFGGSVLENRNPVGSGIRQTPSAQSMSQNDNGRTGQSDQTAMDVFREEGLLASIEFMTRPKIQEIGSGTQPQSSGLITGSAGSLREAPQSRLLANDSNWVSGASRSNGRNDFTANYQAPSTTNLRADGFRSAARERDPSVMQVASTGTLDPSVVSSRVSMLQRDVVGANVDRLNLLLSRLMAAQASGPEINVIAKAAQEVAIQTADPLESQRAQMVVETAQRYQRVAMRRDGGVTTAVVDASTNLSSGISNASANQWSSSEGITNASDINSVTQAQGDVVRQEGYLVQVYSARTNSPPFALTDSAGRTVAYLSPMPGVNLRTLLNQQIGVVGTMGAVAGLDTPHLMVTQAIRISQ